MQNGFLPKSLINKIYFINSCLIALLFLILFAISFFYYASEIYYHGNEMGISEPWYSEIYKQEFLEIFLIFIGIIFVTFLWQISVFNLARKCIKRIQKFRKLSFIFLVYIIQVILVTLVILFLIYYYQIDYLKIDLLGIIKDIILNKTHIVSFVLILFLFFQLRLRKVINLYF